jgi:hypothetical protein
MQGITRYNGEPSVDFTGNTTEFDDELIRRGIVSKRQALLAKGMSEATADRLLAPAAAETSARMHKEEEDEEEDDDDDDDEEFLREYRQRRLEELQQQTQKSNQRCSHPVFGEVVYIDRTEWMRHVNEASLQSWVVVCLTSSDVLRTGPFERIMEELATEYVTTKFVKIPVQSAIPNNFPLSNLPGLFAYRNGQMQHELLRWPITSTKRDVVARLSALSILQTPHSSKEFDHSNNGTSDDSDDANIDSYDELE